MRKITSNTRRGLWGIAALLTVLMLLSACDTLTKPVFPTAPSETVTADDPTRAPNETQSQPREEPVTDPALTETDPPETDPDGETSTELAPAETDPADPKPTEPVTPPACEHNPTVIPTVSPTCTESGASEGYECSLCGEILKAPHEVPPTGHTFTPEKDFTCVSCGYQALCPSPVLSLEGSKTLPWGETLTLSWSLAEDSPFPVVYTVISFDANGNPIELWDSWQTYTTFTYSCRTDGEILALRVCAAFAVNGKPVAATQNVSSVLTVTVSTREALESPAFFVGNRIKAEAGQAVTVDWNPIIADTEDIRYRVNLVTPDGSESCLGTLTDTWVCVPAEHLTAEGDYILRVTAADITETYRESPAAEMVIQVNIPKPVGEEDFENPARYVSDYFYDYLGALPKGDKLQSYYRLIDASLTDFHGNDADGETVMVSGGAIHYYAAKINYTHLGLSLEEAVSVRNLYLYDHPLYYWVSNYYVYNSTAIYFCVDPDYANGETRTACNAVIYDGIAAMAEGLTAEISPYTIALAYYERLLAKADYAYEEDGETPQDDLWAHSIIGVFDSAYNAVVCEGFGKAYSLLLNYHGVENIQITGTSRGVGHLWNLVRLENGEWYWCDITWDDHTYSPLGTDYKYFCVTDTQDVLYYYARDGIEAGLDYSFGSPSTFMDDHSVYWGNVSLDMSGAVPERAETPFDGEVLTLRDTFTVDGMTYALTGYGKVQLVEVGSRRSLTVPETVTYSGVTYTVSSIGLINSEGVFMKGRLIPLFTTSVYIPKTVSYIWDGALSGLLVNVTVDPENPWFVSQNGTVKPRN